MANSNLHAAKVAKNDEFYTQLTDIEKEVKHYKSQFKDKVVLCNCDDPEESNFWVFFSKQFDNYGLKGLISTHYDDSKPSYMLEMKRLEGGTVVTEKTPLMQNGDFRSPECVALLDRADIVVTNPPFSLFREYVAQLMEHKKKFLILGNMNAVTYKEFFPLLKENKVWVGVNEKGGSRKGNSLSFKTPSGDETQVSVWWYTNLDHKRRHIKLPLWETYSPDKFPIYDNYNAIECNKSDRVPADYDGIIGVPISFLNGFYCPEQFEIIWTTDRGGDGMLEDIKIPNAVRYDAPTVNGVGLYKRILIRRKQNS